MSLTKPRWYRLLIWSPVIIALLLAAVIIKQYFAVPRISHVLVLGVDGKDGNLMVRGFHSDAIFIAEINRGTRHLTIEQIPRDTMVDISRELGLEKVAMSLSEVGAAKTCRMIGRLAGCKIDHYVVLTVPDFVALMNTLGGRPAGTSAKSQLGSEFDMLQGQDVALQSIRALLQVRTRAGTDKDRRGQQTAFMSEFVKDRMHVGLCRLPGLARWAWRLDSDLSLVECAAYVRAASGSSIATKTMPTASIYLNGRAYVCMAEHTVNSK